MKKRKCLFLALVITTILLSTTTAYAKIAIGSCPVVQNASAIDKKHLSAYEIHHPLEEAILLYSFANRGSTFRHCLLFYSSRYLTQHPKRLVGSPVSS